MIVETDVKDTPILHWYNLIGEAEVDADYDDEDDEEDDRETDAAFNARIVKYSDVILEYIGNKYSRLLFKQYESAPDIFEELMVNLSNSMHDILPDLDHTKLAEGEQTVFELGKGEKKDSKEQEPDSKRTRKEPVASEAASESQLKTTAASSVDSTPAGAKMNIDGNESTDATTGNAETDRDLGKDFSQGFGGSRLNKRHSKNKTKRVSYFKHKQTRKNKNSRKTK
jgi:hypothetical protein